MFGVAFTPGVLVGTATASTLELTGTVKFIVIVVGLLAGISTVVAIIYGAKWKSTHDVVSALNGALSDRVELVVDERDEAREKLEVTTAVLVDLRATIARLEALPNLERVLQMIGDTFTKLGENLAELHNDHEAAAQQRHEELLGEIRNAA